MKTFLILLVVLSCSALVLCGDSQGLEAILLQFPKHWDDFGEVCDIVGIKVEPEDMETLSKVWAGIIHLAQDRFSQYFSNKH